MTLSIPPHRVALVTSAVPLGGSTSFLLNFAGELVRRGLPAQVVSSELENPLGAEFQQQCVPVRQLNQRGIIFEDRVERMLSHLQEFQPTVVVSTLGPISFEILRYLPKGVFRIGMGQSDDPEVYAMMRQYARWMDAVVMVSQAMKAKAECLPEFARLPVASVPYGVPMCRDEELPVRKFAGPLRILYLGRLSRKQKRTHLFPQVLAELCAAGIPFHWTIAGDGPEMEFLKANLRANPPDQVVSLVGSVDMAQVPALLGDHDVLLLTSEFEGFSLSLLEAMGHGLVPVVTDLRSGIPEVVDSETGMLVPMDDVPGYARAIVHLHQHRDELAAKSAAARLRVKQKYSVPAMTDRWLGVMPPPKEIEPWPPRWHIERAVVAPDTIYFSKPMRVLRRIAVKFKARH